MRPVDAECKLSKEMLVKRYGIVLKDYVDLIVDIFSNHQARFQQIRAQHTTLTDESEIVNNPSIAISTSSCDISLTIQGNVFLDYLSLAAFREEINDFDKLCVNVEVNFKQKTTTYILSNVADLEYNHKPHYFYNTRPFYRSGELQNALEEHVALCTRNNKLHETTRRVIQSYVYHCSKVPRFSVYEEMPNEHTLVVCISGIEHLNAHFVTHLTNLLHTVNITAWVPKCNAELRCEFNLKALEEETKNTEPQQKRRRLFGLL